MAPPLSSPLSLRWLLLLLGAFASPGCEEYGPRVYTARRYRAAQACIEASVAIGVVRTDELASSCEPACLLLDSTLYVSRVCRPHPPLAVALEPQTSPDCAAALASFASKADCAAGVDGGDAAAIDAGVEDARPPRP